MMEVTVMALTLNSLLMVTLMNPVSMVILIISAAFIICVSLKYLLGTSWFSYIMFLIFLGGLMVLFTYICSVASNEQVLMKTKKKMVLMVILSPVLGMTMSFYIMEVNKISHSLESMFSGSALSSLCTTMVYLLMTLFVCVNVAQLKFGPVRTKKN